MESAGEDKNPAPNKSTYLVVAVCLHVYMYACVCVYVCVCVHIHVHANISHHHGHLCHWVMYMYIRACVYVCMCVYSHTSSLLRIFICMHVHAYTHTQGCYLPTHTHLCMWWNGLCQGFWKQAICSMPKFHLPCAKSAKLRRSKPTSSEIPWHRQQ
jgi:hypothetical protein